MVCHNDPDSRDRHLYDEQTSWAYQRPHHRDLCRRGDGEESGCREPDEWTVRIGFSLRLRRILIECMFIPLGFSRKTKIIPLGFIKQITFFLSVLSNK